MPGQKWFKERLTAMRERETEKTSQELSISSNGLVHVPRAPRAKKQMYI